MTSPLAPALNALQAGNPSRAATLLRQRLVDKPDEPDALNLLGMAQLDLELDDLPSALARSLAVAPGEPAFLRNLGLAGLRRDRLETASLGLRHALALMPADTETHLDLGNLTARHGDYVEAERHYARAVLLAPEHVGARQNRGWARLALGDFQRGFQDYAWRWRQPMFAALKSGLSEPWRGQTIDGTLLLFAEQGFGDTLQFCRFVRDANPYARQLVLEVQPELATLLRRSFPDIKVVARGPSFPAPESRPRHDAHAALLDLPDLLRLDLRIPGSTPYLVPHPDKTAAWAKRLTAEAGTRRRIGLVWSGNPRADDPAAAEVDRRRSVSLSILAPLAMADALFVSLQTGVAARAAMNPPPGLALSDISASLIDFDETAAAIANLDLVVTVDTAVAHLAGALGRPVWVLSRCDHCWRWLAGRTDSPWYPTLRLFSQRRPGDWTPVIADLARALRSGAASPGDR